MSEKVLRAALDAQTANALALEAKWRDEQVRADTLAEEVGRLIKEVDALERQLFEMERELDACR